MPVMDGFEVLKNLKGNPSTRAIPVVMLSAVPPVEGERNAISIGAEHYLAKPCDPDVLQLTVKVALREAGTLPDDRGDESKTSEGSTMYPNPPSRSLTRQRAKVRVAIATILVVDDHADTRLLINQIFTKEGYRVIEAEDGRSACEKAVSAKPDLVLLDVMMPGVDGFQVLAKLKELDSTRDIPVIMLTARDGREDMMRGMASAADYITKHASWDELLSSVRNLLTSPDHQRSVRRVSL